MDRGQARRAEGQLVRRRDTGAIVLLVDADCGDGVNALVVDGHAKESTVLRLELELVDQHVIDAM